MGITESKDNIADTDDVKISSVVTMTGGTYTCIRHNSDDKVTYRLYNAIDSDINKVVFSTEDDMYRELRNKITQHQYVTTC